MWWQTKNQNHDAVIYTVTKQHTFFSVQLPEVIHGNATKTGHTRLLIRPPRGLCHLHTFSGLTSYLRVLSHSYHGPLIGDNDLPNLNMVNFPVRKAWVTSKGCSSPWGLQRRPQVHDMYSWSRLAPGVHGNNGCALVLLPVQEHGTLAA